MSSLATALAIIETTSAALELISTGQTVLARLRALASQGEITEEDLEVLRAETDTRLAEYRHAIGQA